MNIEKLNELLPNPEFVDYQHPNGPTDFYDDSRMFEYANTIIQECISVIEPDDHPVDEINYRYAIISDIKRHFGLEDED